MGRPEIREQRRLLKPDIVEFVRIQNHYFPDLISDIRSVMDARNQSYIVYEIEVILYVMIIKNVCSIVSMQEMTDLFNKDEVVHNIYKILGLKDKDFLPHYVTINACLAKLDNAELDKVRKKMVYAAIRKKSFAGAKFLGKHWLVIVDATQLFHFDHKHCEHCTTKTTNKGKPDEKTHYYHYVLEAKIVLGDNIVISIASEFIENPEENPSKQDCEIKAFKRLAETLKNAFPRLPICLLGDSLYACAPVFDICKAKGWEYLIRYKDGSIPTLAKEVQKIEDAGNAEEKTVDIEEINKRKPNALIKHKARWVNALEYSGHTVAVLELAIEQEGKDDRFFQWISSRSISEKSAIQYAEAGRKRWKIENKGFNIQKNHRYMIKHANTLDYNGMKNHYLLTQIADFLMQLYENGIKGIRQIKRTIANICGDLKDCLLKYKLTDEDIEYQRMQIRT
jgi:hypothetical protein